MIRPSLVRAFHSVGVAFHPNDIAGSLDDDSVRVDGVELHHQFAGPIRIEREKARGVRPVHGIERAAGIGEVQAAVRTECKIVRGAKRVSRDFRDQDFNLAAWRDPLDRWRTLIGRRATAR